ncbi:MAG: hypothetical protein BWY26_01706 [Elusimicrobia bacterium ADurb.Bin231]|nr:MAG: hypothetical protein BWY26_01706 [Elusimicrobia bacterium ADurb.Bin231]
MNVIFLTQSRTLDLFFPLMQAINGITPLKKIGFYLGE